MPVVTTLHTVLQQPNPAQRKVMDALAARSERLVVMARKGAEILQEIYHVPEAKIEIIPHGIPDVPLTESRHFKTQFGVEGRAVLLTFGLMGPGKGIEHVIEALPAIVRKHPDVVYLVLGATHPQLVAREGERYRLGLAAMAGHRAFCSPRRLLEQPPGLCPDLVRPGAGGDRLQYRQYRLPACPA